MALDNGTPHRPFPLLIAFDAGFQRHAKKDHGRRHLMLLRQVEQILSSLGSQSRGVHDAQSVQRQSLCEQEVDQVKGLLVEPLIAFIVANKGARPIRRYYLGRPKVAFGKRGFSATRRAAKYDNRRPKQAE